VYAAILEATGHHDDAQTEKDKIKIDNLLPEERALIGECAINSGSFSTRRLRYLRSPCLIEKRLTTEMQPLWFQ
jgi:hypothetical protein